MGGDAFWCESRVGDEQLLFWYCSRSGRVPLSYWTKNLMTHKLGRNAYCCFVKW